MVSYSTSIVLCVLCVLSPLLSTIIVTENYTTSFTDHPTFTDDVFSSVVPTPGPATSTESPAPARRQFTAEEEKCLARARETNSARHRKALIACLLPFNESRLFSVQRVRPAIAVAVDKIILLGLLPQLTLEVSYRDSKCSISDGMNQAVNYYANNTADVYFGPTCDYAAAPVARQVRYWNTAMVTAGAMAGDFGLRKSQMFPLLTRVGTNFNSLVDCLKAILCHFHWKRVKLVYNPNGYMHIMDRYCHIAMDAVHHGLHVANALNQVDIEQDHSKFFNDKQALLDLPYEVGIRFSVVCYSVFSN